MSCSRRRRRGPSRSATFSRICRPMPTTAADTGTPLASFLLGQVQQFSIDLQQDEIRNRAHFQEYFIQDDWRLSERFTVNGGIRYTLNFPSTETNDQAAVFNLQTQQLEFLGRDGQPRAARDCTSTTSVHASAWSDESPTRRSSGQAMRWCGSRWQVLRHRSRRRSFRSSKRSLSARSTISSPRSSSRRVRASNPFR